MYLIIFWIHRKIEQEQHGYFDLVLLIDRKKGLSILLYLAHLTNMVSSPISKPVEMSFLLSLSITICYLWNLSAPICNWLWSPLTLDLQLLWAYAFLLTSGGVFGLSLDRVFVLLQLFQKSSSSMPFHDQINALHFSQGYLLKRRILAN